MSISLSLMIEIAHAKFPRQLHESISNFLSCLFNAMFYIGAFTGPFMFTFIYGFLGWRASMDILTLLTFVYLLVYTVFIYKLKDTKI